MSQSNCPRPKRFEPAHGVYRAKLIDPPAFIANGRKPRGRRAAGIRYEAKAQRYLHDVLGPNYISSPWFCFWQEGRAKPRYCQPDGLLIDFLEGRITVYEIKLQHTLDAWWQLEHLYVPVLQAAFPSSLWKFSTCEVVRWYDPATKYPVIVNLCGRVESPREDSFSVHIWKP